MSLMLVATEVGADLVTKIRHRIAEGAAVWEIAADGIQASTTGTVRAAFQSPFATVAVLADGRTVVRRAR